MVDQGGEGRTLRKIWEQLLLKYVWTGILQFAQLKSFNLEKESQLASWAWKSCMKDWNLGVGVLLPSRKSQLQVTLLNIEWKNGLVGGSVLSVICNN